MTARPVLLDLEEAQELELRVAECESETALRQYLAELIVLRQLLAATRSRSIGRIERALARLNRPSFIAQRAASEPPPLGSERLI